MRTGLAEDVGVGRARQGFNLDDVPGERFPDAVRRAERMKHRVRCLRIAMLSLALMGAAVGCSRGAAQSTGSTGDQSHPPPSSLDWWGGRLPIAPLPKNRDVLWRPAALPARHRHLRLAMHRPDRVDASLSHSVHRHHQRASHCRRNTRAAPALSAQPARHGRLAASPASWAANLAHPIRRRKRHDQRACSVPVRRH